MNYEIVIRFLVSIACSSLIGYERETKGKSAGFRTHALVAFGATFITVIASLEFAQNIDSIARVVTGVVTGIGFICAGTILRSDSEIVYGLTTAADLWAVALVGIGIGLGYYTYSIIGTVLIYALLNLLALKKGRKK